jgi:hypothetical protein
MECVLGCPHAPSTMLRMVPLPPHRGGGTKNHYRMVGITYSAPARMPVGQREVMVLSFV